MGKPFVEKRAAPPLAVQAAPQRPKRDHSESWAGPAVGLHLHDPPGARHEHCIARHSARVMITPPASGLAFPAQGKKYLKKIYDDSVPRPQKTGGFCLRKVPFHSPKSPPQVPLHRAAASSCGNSRRKSPAHGHGNRMKETGVLVYVTWFVWVGLVCGS